MKHPIWQEHQDPHCEQPAFFLSPKKLKRYGSLLHAVSSSLFPAGGFQFLAIDEPTSAVVKKLGWKPPSSWGMLLNRGRAGQFTIGYPVPYVFEGHLKEPLAAVINQPYRREPFSMQPEVAG